MKTRKFAVTLEIQLEAETPKDAAEEFVRRIRMERHAFQVDVMEDRGEDQWEPVGRPVVRVDEVESA